jgi:lipoyl-dependent peroxiredoxin
MRLPGDDAMSAERYAETVWEHDLAKGSGRVRGGSGAFQNLAVTWASRTEAPAGKTSPEELLAAAHASCFAMAFSATLGRNQHPPERLTVKATSTFDKVGEAWRVTKIDLAVRGKVPGLDPARFSELAQTAEKGCPISNALRGNVAISVAATLE